MCNEKLVISQCHDPTDDRQADVSAKQRSKEHKENIKALARARTYSPGLGFVSSLTHIDGIAA